jgi:threonine dehydratase
VDEILLVGNDEICAAIKDVFDDTRAIVEPAGALAVAGVKAYTERTKVRDGEFAALLSGANMNFDRLRFVAERAELGEFREALFGVTIPERPGAFRQFCAALGPRVITEFNYRLNSRARAEIFVGMSVRSREDAIEVQTKLNTLGYETADLTRSEMAKLHVRHMVGGMRRVLSAKGFADLSFPSVPVRCSSSWTRWEVDGTSVCFTTAITAAMPVACWLPSRYRNPMMPRSRDSWLRWDISIRLRTVTRLTDAS